jgi:hypothetical protein
MTTYRRRKVSENPERQILLGMIVSDKFIRDVQPILKTDLIETPFILTVIGWCQEYYKQFESAPGIHIEDIYKKQVRNGNLDDDQEKLISDLLLSLNTEYERAEQFNSAYTLDQAEKHFESRNLANKVAGIKQGLSRGDVAAAQKEILEYKRISLPQSNGIDPFTDRDGMQKAFESAGEPLFRLPGAVGKFLNDLFVRDGFVTLLGPEKRGKTFLLIELSMWARKAGLNVAFFSAGDMTTPQLQLRYGIRFTGRSHKPRYCGELKVPILDCWHNQDDSCDCSHRAGIWGIVKDKEKGELLTYEEAKDHVVCTHCLKNKEEGYIFKGSSWFVLRSPVTPLVWTDAIKAGEKLNRRWGKKSKMRLSSYANNTLTIEEIRHQLNLWQDEDGFVPDVIITDYMDLIVPNHDRNAINQAWASMRGLSQEKHCLVISASQSDAESQYLKWLGYKNFSEDKRKFSHVTGTITLNQLPEEKLRRVMRLGMLAVREDDSDQKNYVTILQSLAQGRAIVDSF